MNILRGIDVASPQGIIDWPAWQKPTDFLICRCGNGNESPDPNFLRNLTGARSRGVQWLGVYSVAMPLPPDAAHPGRDPISQAGAHYQACGGYGRGGDEINPALDLEWPVPGSPEWKQYGLTPAFVRDWALAYLDEAKRLWGKTPILYDGFPDYAKAIDFAAEPSFGDYPLWCVDYPSALVHSYPIDDSLLVVPPPWQKATFWQCGGGAGTVPVIYPDGTRGSQKVDLDVFFGDAAAMTTFCSAGIQVQ